MGSFNVIFHGDLADNNGNIMGCNGKYDRPGMTIKHGWRFSLRMENHRLLVDVPAPVS